MKCEIVWKRGRAYIRVDFRPARRIRRAKERIAERQAEIFKHFGKEKAKP